MNDENTPIVVEVVRFVCGHNARVGRAHVAEGPAYVKCHTDAGELPAVCLALVEAGHVFSVRHVDRHLNALEWYGASASEVASFNAKLKADT